MGQWVPDLMDEPKVVVVMLRPPSRNRPNEMGTDPLWELGSFGSTRCHRRNLMNPCKLHELGGSRFAFAQGGNSEVKLVHGTPPLEFLHHGQFAEAKWEPAEMPLFCRPGLGSDVWRIAAQRARTHQATCRTPCPEAVQGGKASVAW